MVTSPLHCNVVEWLHLGLRGYCSPSWSSGYGGLQSSYWNKQNPRTARSPVVMRISTFPPPRSNQSSPEILITLDALRHEGARYTGGGMLVAGWVATMIQLLGVFIQAGVGLFSDSTNRNHLINHSSLRFYKQPFTHAPVANPSLMLILVSLMHASVSNPNKLIGWIISG